MERQVHEFGQKMLVKSDITPRRQGLNRFYMQTDLWFNRVQGTKDSQWQAPISILQNPVVLEAVISQGLGRQCQAHHSLKQMHYRRSLEHGHVTNYDPGVAMLTNCLQSFNTCFRVRQHFISNIFPRKLHYWKDLLLGTFFPAVVRCIKTLPDQPSLSSHCSAIHFQWLTAAQQNPLFLQQ